MVITCYGDIARHNPTPSVTPDLRDQLQSTLGDAYLLERELGAGGMSRVFVAEDRTLGRHVVVKVLPPELVAEVSVARFRREIQLAARLQHPHIVPFFDAHEANGVIYYTMPFIEGETLRERLKRERQLPVGEAVRLAREVADALAYAHQHNVVHRDIKPENILLSAGHALVVDFGIARGLSRSSSDDTLTLTGMSIGTPIYMSPEQASGEREIDGRSDTYSLGCVLYEMLAGIPPFMGATAQATIAKRFTEPAPRVRDVRPSVSPAIEGAIEKALASVPADRFATALDFAHALAEPVPTPVAVNPSVQGRRSIAVLPFANVSSDPENEYFSDGITDDIISQLSKIGSLKVISRTSTARYRNTEKNIRQIARELGVEAILEGSVRRAGNRVRVIAQLIDATADEHLWAETYDRDLTDVFAIQSDVALQVAGGLRTVLAPEERKRVERKPTENIDAYNLLLLGRFALNRRLPDDLKRGMEYFSAAIALDPTYAAPHAGLADAYTLAAIGYGAAPTDALARAKAAALDALRLDESLPEAHTSLGYVYLNYDWDFFAAEREFRRAIELNPSSAQAYQWYSHAFGYIQQHDDALTMVRRALELDPLSVVLTAELAWPHLFKLDFEKAMIHTRRALAMDPTFVLARYNLVQELAALGRIDEAMIEAKEALHPSAGMAFFVAFVARVYAQSGQRDAAQSILLELTARADQGQPVHAYVAMVLDALRQPDEMFSRLERALTAREPMLAWLHTTHPGFENYRSDVRFDDLLRRVGMAEQARRYTSGRSSRSPVASSS